MEHFLREYQANYDIDNEDIQFYISSYRKRKFVHYEDHNSYPKLLMKIRRVIEDNEEKITIVTRTVPNNLDDLKVIK